MSIFQDIKQRIERGMEQAGQTSQRMIDIGRYNSRIKAKKEEVEEAISRLGWSVFYTYQSQESLDESSEVARGLKQVQFLQDQVRDLEDKLESVANITNHATVEKINFSQSEPDIINNQPLAVHQPVGNTVIYICPYCAYQVGKPDRKCAHCHRTFF